MSHPNTTSTPCTVAFASNENGIAPLSMSIWSLLRHAKESTVYDIRILSEEISDSSKKHLHSVVESFGARHKLSFIEMAEFYKNTAQLDNLCGRWPYSTWARAFTPKLMPDVQLLLYLDIDILVCDDCHKLFEIDMKNKAAGVVYEADPSPDAYFRKRLDLPLDIPGYFNAGVLLMNLDVFRQENLTDKMLTFARNNADVIEYPDQDPLNAVLYDKAIKLHPRWNWNDLGTRRLIHRKADSTRTIRTATVKEAVEASLYPGIIHFCGDYKPWQYDNHHIMSYLYEEAVHESGLPGFNLKKGWTLGLWFKRLSHQIVYLFTWKKIHKLARQLNITGAPESQVSSTDKPKKTQ